MSNEELKQKIIALAGEVNHNLNEQELTIITRESACVPDNILGPALRCSRGRPSGSKRAGKMMECLIKVACSMQLQMYSMRSGLSSPLLKSRRKSLKKTKNDGLKNLLVLKT